MAIRCHGVKTMLRLKHLKDSDVEFNIFKNIHVMKKSLVFFIFVITATVLTGQPLEIKDGLYYKKDMLYSGTHIEYYDNGNPKMELNVKDGMEHGLVFLYFENGRKQEQRSYNSGKKDGTWIKWNQAGIKLAEANYKDDLKDGKWFIWSDKGVMLYDMQYANGEKTGTWKMWDQDGHLTNERTY